MKKKDADSALFLAVVEGGEADWEVKFAMLICH